MTTANMTQELLKVKNGEYSVELADDAALLINGYTVGDLLQVAEDFGKTIGRIERQTENQEMIEHLLDHYGIPHGYGMGEMLYSLREFINKAQALDMTDELLSEQEVVKVDVGKVRVFPGVMPSKQQALKIIEEAAEVYAAWQEFDSWKDRPSVSAYEKQDLLDEIADVIQAACNLASSLGISDLKPYMHKCEQRNRDRGRYDVVD